MSVSALTPRRVWNGTEAPIWRRRWAIAASATPHATSPMRWTTGGNLPALSLRAGAPIMSAPTGHRAWVIAVAGSSARKAEGCKDIPVDNAIIGIVDEVHLD